jgi:hypothetical protein
LDLSNKLSSAEEPTCPECGSIAVRGELVSESAPALGFAVYALSGDAAAAVAAGEIKQSVVKSFCLGCGGSWYPRALYLRRILAGPLSSERRGPIVRIVLDEAFQGVPRWMFEAFESYYADAVAGRLGSDHRESARRELASIAEASNGFRLISEKRAAHVRWATSILERRSR